MKNYRDVANSVFQRREEYLKEKERKKSLFIKRSALALSCCVMIFVCFGIWRMNKIRPELPPSINDPANVTETITSFSNTKTTYSAHTSKNTTFKTTVATTSAASSQSTATATSKNNTTAETTAEKTSVTEAVTNPRITATSYVQTTRRTTEISSTTSLRPTTTRMTSVHTTTIVTSTVIPNTTPRRTPPPFTTSYFRTTTTTIALTTTTYTTNVMTTSMYLTTTWRTTTTSSSYITTTSRPPVLSTTSIYTTSVPPVVTQTTPAINGVYVNDTFYTMTGEIYYDTDYSDETCIYEGNDPVPYKIYAYGNRNTEQYCLISFEDGAPRYAAINYSYFTYGPRKKTDPTD